MRRCRVLAAGAVGAFLMGPTPALPGPTIPEIVEVADITSLSTSPSGRYVAFRLERASIDRNTYQLDWYVSDLATSLVAQVADGGEAIEGGPEPLAVEPVAWSQDERFIFHRVRRDGAIAIWRTAVDGSGSRAVVLGDADVEQLVPDTDGATLTFVLGPSRDEIRRAEKREYDDGILVDGSIDLEQNLYRGGWVSGQLASQRLIGRWYSRAGLLWNAPRRRLRLDLQTLETEELGSVEPPAANPFVPGSGAALALRQSGRPDVLVRSNNGQSAIEIVRESGTVACEDAACRAPVVALAWRPATDELVFTTQDAHFRQTLARWDTRRGGVTVVASGDGLLSGSRSETRPCAMTHTTAVCVAAEAVSPPSLVAIDLSSGRRTVLFDPNATLRGRDTATVRQLTWRLADGRTATGTLLMPSDIDSPAPLFVTYYYCPGFLRGGIGDEYPLAPLVDAGFVVACLNTVPDARRDIIADYTNGQASVEALVGQLASEGLVDRTRVGMGGFSAGSEATMWIAAHSQVLAAAAIASPQYNPSSYWSHARPDRDYAGVLQGFLGLGSPDETAERWQLVSPAAKTDRITAAVLMQLPENEARSQGEIFTRLSRGAVPVEMFAFPDESHVKFQPRHRRAVYARNLDWFRYWLQGYVDPDRAKEGQFRRWDGLRAQRDAAQVSKDRSQSSAEAISSRRM